MKKRNILLIFCLLAATTICVVGCKDNKTEESSLNGNTSTSSIVDNSSLPSIDSSSIGQTPVDTYTLFFDGLEEDAALTVEKGKAIGVLPVVPKKEGFEPNGWKIGEEKITANTVWTYSENKTAQPVYATGTANYTVEHWFENLETGSYVKDESKTESKQGTVDTMVAAIALNATEGYEKDSQHENSNEVGTVKADGSLTLKVYYTLKKYTVTLKTHKTLETDALTVKHGGKIEGLADPTWEDFDFVGWLKDGEEFNLSTPITTDIILSAKYERVIEVNTTLDFLNIGLDATGKPYNETVIQFITYELTKDFIFSTEDFNKNKHLIDNVAATIDGKGHKVWATFKNNSNEAMVGVFGNITGSIKNVFFDIDIETKFNVAALCDKNSGVIENCYFDVNISSNAKYFIQNDISFYEDLWMKRSGLIIYNSGSIKNCVVNMQSYSNFDAWGVKRCGEAYAIAKSNEGIIDKIAVISSGNVNYNQQEIIQRISVNRGYDVNTEGYGSDSTRNDCYLFDTVSAWLSGSGVLLDEKGNKTQTAYTTDYYTGAYWSDWKALLTA